MMRISVNSPCFIYSDKQLVLWNTTHSDSVLKKKRSSVVHHHMREGVSSDEWCITYINTKLSSSDIFISAQPYNRPPHQSKLATIFSFSVTILKKNLSARINQYNKVVFSADWQDDV